MSPRGCCIAQCLAPPGYSTVNAFTIVAGGQASCQGSPFPGNHRHGISGTNSKYCGGFLSPVRCGLRLEGPPIDVAQAWAAALGNPEEPYNITHFNF